MAQEMMFQTEGCSPGVLVTIHFLLDQTQVDILK